jgi:hypothetical protein
MFEGSWLVGGLLAVVTYVIISNTLWLLFGSRLLQLLPGVNIPGVYGTLRIAAMLVLSLLGVCSWLLKRPLHSLVGIGQRPSLECEMAAFIQRGARVFSRRPRR